MELLSGTIRLDYLLMLVQEPKMRKEESKQACLNYASRDPEPNWPEST
jgi:hypothetical protein